MSRAGRLISGFVATLISACGLLGQTDSVDVTFYYTPSGSHVRVFVPGEFNGWGPNSNGTISAGAPSEMEFNDESGRWHKTVRLRIGGHEGGSVSGAYQYKFNIDGSGTGWLADPLNPRENPLDNNNSILYVREPTIYHLVPNAKTGIVETRNPEVSAYLYPSAETSIDASTIVVEVAGFVYDNLEAYFDESSGFFSFQIPDPVPGGQHTLKLSAGAENGGMNADSAEFVLEAGFIRILNRSNDMYIRPTIRIDGTVEDAEITQATLRRNDEVIEVAVQDGLFSELIELEEGLNTIYAVVPAVDDSVSDHIEIQYVIERRPKPLVAGSVDGEEITLSIAELNEGNMINVEYMWYPDDSINPETIYAGGSGESISFPIPELPGEYYFNVDAVNFVIADIFPERFSRVNSNGTWWGSARTAFTVNEDGSVRFAGTADNPAWVDSAIVYEIYVPAFASGGGGNFQHVINRLPELQDLGINVIWFTPIYDNNESINTLNAGYNIADFYSVHPQLGTMATFESLIETAHGLGIRIILDSTPNHVGGLHPWLNDLSLYRDYSNYRPVIENRLIGNSRDLGHSIVYSDGVYPLYARYSNWTLPNLNYQNPETVQYMLDMYAWWLLEKKIDGFRMDVYWGPENRYGKNTWWRPFREEIKRRKPDILIIGETDGTGPGSENNYADTGGASDAAYDWNLYGYARNVLNGSGTISDLHNRVNNFAPAGEPYTFYTGENAHYFRFLENHDETRLAQLYGTARSRAGAVLNLTIPGIPMIYAGQEVGETSQRGTIIWSRTGGSELRDYYKRLTHGRRTFGAFTTRQVRQIPSGHARVYAYSRPYRDENAIIAINFSNNQATAMLAVSDAHLAVSTDSLLTDMEYYLNDILNDSSSVVTGAGLASLPVALGPWESVVYILADSAIRLVTAAGVSPGESLPDSYSIEQNYPNPFNPMTSIQFTVPKAGHVAIRVFDVLGREVATLVDEHIEAGVHSRIFNAAHLSSGIYFYRIDAGDFVAVRRMVLVK